MKVRHHQTAHTFGNLPDVSATCTSTDTRLFFSIRHPQTRLKSFLSIEHIDPSVKHCQSMSLNLSKWEFWLYDTSILVRVSNGVELDDCRIVFVVFPMKISATFWSESEFRIRFQPTFLTAPLHQMAQVWWCSICGFKPLRTIVCRYSFVVGPSQG